MLTKADKRRKYIEEFAEFFKRSNGKIDNDEIIKFLRFKTPGLVLDFDSLFDGFFDKDQKVFANKLFILNSVKADEEKNRAHIKEVDNAYDLYLKLIEEKYKGNNFIVKYDRDSFYNDYRVISEVSMSTNIKELDFDDRDIPKIARSFLDIFPLEECFDLLSKFAFDRVGVLNELNDKFIETTDQRYDDLVETMRRKTSKLLPINLAINVYCYLYYAFRNDCLIENHLVYHRFFSSLDIFDNPKYSAAVIFDASPLFIKKVAFDKMLQNQKLIFVNSSKSTALLFETYFKKSPNIRSIYVGDEIDDDVIELMKDQRISFMFLGNHINNLAYKKYCFEKINDAFDIDKLFIFDEDPEIKKIANTIENAHFYASEIELLPYGINDPEKSSAKMLVELVRHNESQTIVTHYSLVKRHRDYQSLNPKTYEKILDNTSLSQLSDTIRSEFTTDFKDSLRKSDRQRNRAQIFDFSPEIKFIYSCSYDKNRDRYRVEASALVFTGDDKKERIANTLKRTNQKTLDDVQHWLTYTFPYESTTTKDGEIFDIHKLVIDAYRRKLRGRYISLRSFVYLNEDEIINSYGKNQVDIIRQIVSSDIGALDIDYISISFVDRYLQKLVDEGFSVDEIGYKTVLSRLIDLAIEKGNARVNQIKDDVKEAMMRNDHGYDEARANLTYRFFSEEEIQKIYKIIIHEIDKDILYLGAFIKLVTGLESNIVCGLKWKDFVPFSDYEGLRKQKYHLMIARQVFNDGSDYAKFKRVVSYRMVPCSEELRDLLLQEKKRQMKKYHYEEEMDFFKEMPIIANDESKNLLTAPIDLTGFCNKLVRKIRKGKSLLCTIPDSKKGLIETDFMNYSGDIFRSNYRHYAILECGFRESEVDYLLGRQTNSIFAMNYCDYGNEVAQALIAIKQDRFMNIFKKSSEDLPSSFELIGRRKDYFSSKTKSGRREVTFGIDVKENEVVKVKIDNSYGFDLTINRRRKK